MFVYFQANIVVCYSKINNTIKSTAHHPIRPLFRQISSNPTTSTVTSTRFPRSSNLNALEGLQTRGPGRRHNNPAVESNSMAGNDHLRGHNHRHSLYSIEDNVRSLFDLSPTRKPPHHAAAGSYKGLSRERREIFTYRLSIPTTINEESTSRSRTFTSCERLGDTSILNEAEEQHTSTLSTPNTVRTNLMTITDQTKTKKKKRKHCHSTCDDNSTSESLNNSSDRFRSVSSSDSISPVCSCSTCRSAALQSRAASSTPVSSYGELDIQCGLLKTARHTYSDEDHSSQEVVNSQSTCDLHHSPKTN